MRGEPTGSTGADDEAVATVRRARRVCFFAHYHPDGIVADHVLFYLAALREAGFAIVVASTATMDEGERRKLAGAATILIQRANTGLDFGGWIDAVRLTFPLSADWLLLTNDSVYGPLLPFEAMFARLTAPPADFYGMVESWETRRHIQSWFLLLRPSAYRSGAFEALMTTPPDPALTKRQIIDRYELSFAQTLWDAGLASATLWSPRASGRLARRLRYNPMHLLWRRMVERHGIPFLKIELLRDNPNDVASIVHWPRVTDAHGGALTAAVRADLDRRQRWRPRGLRTRLREGFGVTPAFVWPEARAFLHADDALPAGRTNAVIAATFDAVVPRIRRAAARLLRPGQ